MGVTTRAQLVADGVPRSQWGYRLLPSVYSTSGEPGYLDRCAAVALWKPTAVLSHDTAAWLWGLLDKEPEIVHVTVPRSGQSRSPEWVTVHRRTVSMVFRHRGLRVVSVEQCFVDVATTLDRSALEAFVDQALSRKMNWREVAELCDECAGMHGIPAVREQLRRCCLFTRSEPERVLARGLSARNFAMEINAVVGRYYGDLVDRRARVIVEVDGREFHIGAQVFSSDRRRQNELQLDGWLVLRYSAATVMFDLDAVVDEIITVVRRRRRSRAS